MGGQFDHARLVLVPLTPVHVGGGEESVLSPEAYRLAGNTLEVFSLPAVLARLPEAERASFANALLKDPLSGTDLLRDKVTPEDIRERIALGEDSREELGLVLSPPKGARGRRRGDVSLFQRSGEGPILPGSTLKGAIRTAWLARWSAGLSAPEGRQSWQRHASLETVAFALAPGKARTDTDPMRDVSIADCALGLGVTRIDRILTWKRTPSHRTEWAFQDTGQMHWERMRSVADGGEPALVEIDIAWRASAVTALRLEKGRRDAVPGRAPEGIGAVLASLNAHHRPLWHREAEETFFAGAPGERLRATLGIFDGIRLEGEDPDGALVRVGRGGHAESKSVAAFREVHRPQARSHAERFAREGTTRHVVEIAGRPVPFGWCLLVRADRFRTPDRWLEAVERPAAGSVGGRAVPAGAEGLRGNLIFRRGEKAVVDDEEVTVMEDVPAGAREANVAFPGGDIETIDVEEIHRR